MKTYQSGGGYYFKEYNNGKKVRISREQYMKSNKSQRGGELKDYVWRIDEQENKLHIIEKNFLIAKLSNNLNIKRLKIIELDYALNNHELITDISNKLFINTGIRYDITYDKTYKKHKSVIYNIINMSNIPPIQMGNLNNKLNKLTFYNPS